MKKKGENIKCTVTVIDSKYQNILFCMALEELQENLKPNFQDETKVLQGPSLQSKIV